MGAKALLVLGMTLQNLDPSAPEPVLELPRLLEAVAGEIRYFRGHRRSVAFVVPGPPGLAAKELLAQVHPSLRPDQLDTVFPQPSLSAFRQTGLEEWLKERSVEGVTIVGVRSHVEVLYTAADAYMMGLPLVIPTPCISSTDSENHGFALRQIREILLQGL